MGDSSNDARAGGEDHSQVDEPPRECHSPEDFPIEGNIFARILPAGGFRSLRRTCSPSDIRPIV